MAYETSQCLTCSACCYRLNTPPTRRHVTLQWRIVTYLWRHKAKCQYRARYATKGTCYKLGIASSPAVHIFMESSRRIAMLPDVSRRRIWHIARVSARDVSRRRIGHITRVSARYVRRRRVGHVTKVSAAQKLVRRPQLSTLSWNFHVILQCISWRQPATR